MTVGERIKEVRLRNNLSLRDFGKIIGEADTTVMRWEHGTAKVSFDTIIAISKRFGYSPNWFAGMEADA